MKRKMMDGVLTAALALAALGLNASAAVVQTGPVEAAGLPAAASAAGGAQGGVLPVSLSLGTLSLNAPTIKVAPLAPSVRAAGKVSAIPAIPARSSVRAISCFICE